MVATPGSLKDLAQLLQDNLQVDLESSSGASPNRSIVIGYSGGLDSSLLLHAAAIAYPEENILAVHCNHGISNDAQSWADHCKKQADQLNVSFAEKKLDLGKNTSEETARHARYQFFSEQMERLDRPVLLLAHHADDQIETLLFRLFRGSGLKGLSAIPKSRDMEKGKLLRPFLNIKKSVLLDIAQAEAISWIEDESNQADDYDRNFLRNKLLPLIYQRWPKAPEQLLQARNIFEDSDRLLGEYAELLVAGLEPREEAFGTSYSIAQFKKLTTAQYGMVLRYLVVTNASYAVKGNRTIQLKNSDLTEIELQFFSSKDDAKPEFKISCVELRRYKGRLYILIDLPKDKSIDTCIQWDGKQPLEIKGLGILSLEEPSYSKSNDKNNNLSNGPFEVRFRQGSERAKPVTRDHSQRLKKLMQEFEIEPWLRSRIPLVFQKGKLLSAGDSIPCSEHKFSWQWQDSSSKQYKKPGVFPTD